MLTQAKLHEQIVDRIAHDVVSGRLPTNSPVPPESRLIEEFDVSKTVVREAMQTLAALGVVRIRHGKRTVVLPESEWNILSPVLQNAYWTEGLARPLVSELYEVRLSLEPRAARWTAERANEEQREHIADLSHAMEEARGAQFRHVDHERFLDHDRELHLSIAASGANRVLRAIVRDIYDLMVTSWGWSMLSEEQVDTAFKQHAAIVDAILKRDPDRAESTMHTHLQWASRTDDACLRAAPAASPNEATVAGGGSNVP